MNIVFYEVNNKNVHIVNVIYDTLDGYPHGVGLDLAKYIKHITYVDTIDNIIDNYIEYYKKCSRERMMNLFITRDTTFFEMVKDDCKNKGLYVYDRDIYTDGVYLYNVYVDIKNAIIYIGNGEDVYSADEFIKRYTLFYEA